MPIESKHKFLLKMVSNHIYISHNHSLIQSWLFLVFTLFSSSSLFSQSSQIKVATTLKEHAKIYSLSPTDISDWVITDEHISKTSGVHHIYTQQHYQGIEIFKANASFHFLANGRLLKQSNHFIPNINQKIQINFNPISAKAAIAAIAKTMNYPLAAIEVVANNVNGNQTIWSDGGISRRNIPSKPVYVLNEQNQLVLSWDISIYEKDAPNWWSFKVDAGTGKILAQDNWVINCTWDTPTNLSSKHQHPSKNTISKPIKSSLQSKIAISLPLSEDSECPQNFPSNETSSSIHPQTITAQKNNLSDNATYTVYPLGIINPDVSGRMTITNPAKPNTSPFGWHDTNGIAGAEYTITRGNNVWAKEDRANDDETTIGFSPDGGNNLDFDYALDFKNAPIDNQEAALTNLFYWCNIVHDVAYQYGFDEASGNFQFNNYNKGGLANDYLLADGFDGSGFNNANIGVPPDGSRPTMQMFLWNIVDFEVNSPTTLSHTFAVRAATFGATNYDLSGNILLVADTEGNATEGCSGNYSNTSEINGNIALIDRGNCEFGTKCLNAQNAGAIAVIICNNEPGNLLAGGGTNGGQVIIPVTTMSQEDCTILKTNLNEGVNIRLSSNLKDSNFDNGIISHEYAHGISTRLIGGAGTNICLFNEEQMGEGWSDWYALMLTMQAEDNGSQSRGVGTYVTNESINGTGIRPFPYSTDLTINPHTYVDIPNLSVPHGVGTVWCAMLWEMTWNLIDNYGFDTDLYNGLGGNNIALNLVTEGLKLTSCFPGFVDGRDAILAADTALYNGKFSYEIWTAFAKRGLGVSANQGNNSNIADGQAAFDLPPPFQDTDGDGIPNFKDICAKGNDLIDLDNNGVPDLCELCETNETDLILSNQVLSQGFYEATNSIQTTGLISVNSSDTVILRANQSITLKTGFSASGPAYFIALIDDCTTTNSSTPTTISNSLKTNTPTTIPLHLSIFPNPTNGQTTFNLQLSEPQMIRISLFNAQGQVVQVLQKETLLATGQHTLSINMATFPAGVYFMQLQGKKSITTKRLIVGK